VKHILLVILRLLLKENRESNPARKSLKTYYSDSLIKILSLVPI